MDTVQNASAALVPSEAPRRSIKAQSVCRVVVCLSCVGSVCVGG